MPLYLFKCQGCGKDTEINISFGEMNKMGEMDCVGTCNTKRCKCELFKVHQQINFAGGINMNSSAVGVAKRKYSNKEGGPRPFVDGKLKPDMKPNW